jgi:hypothetical protein
MRKAHGVKSRGIVGVEEGMNNENDNTGGLKK